MGEAYTVYWRQDIWRQAAWVGQEMKVFYGGPHTSQPSFRRATVKSGDTLYPIGMCSGVLYVFGRVRVAEVTPVDDDHRVEEYLTRFRAWRFLRSTCTTEIVTTSDSTRVHMDRPVPGEVLKRLTYQPRRRKPRPVRGVTDDGRLAYPLSIQGIYRVTDASAADLDAVLNGPAGEPPEQPGARKRWVAPVGMDPLF